MSAGEPGFGTLVYTDCRPGQGLKGGAGFQFQAVSAGVGEEAKRIVETRALYEAHGSWIRSRGVADFPPSLTHVAEGRFVTAAGVYLGKEANGTRDGNQLTHALVTEEGTDYGRTRPAQLWRAPWWSTVPAPSTACARHEADLEPGPWDAAAVAERLRSVPDAETTLATLVSAVRHVRTREHARVVLVTPDADEAACWLVAATLLLPQPEALRVSFKIFTTQPDRAPHDVLVIHPDWAASTQAGRATLVFDLAKGTRPAIEVGAEAAFWVPLFLHGDAFDVADAVDLAGELDGGEPGDDAHGRIVAALAGGLVPAPPRVEVPALARWLAAAPRRAEVAGPGTVAVLAAAAGPDGLPALDAVALDRADAWREEDSPWDPVAADVRRRLLRAELDAATATRDPDDLRRTMEAASLPRPAEAVVRAGERDLDAALRTGAGSRSPVLLAVAHRHGLRPDPAALHDVVAHWWADHPDVDVNPRTWTFGPTVLDALRDVLHHRLDDPIRGERTRRDLVEYWWPRLWRGISVPRASQGRELLDAVDGTLARAAFTAGDDATAGEVVRGLLADTVAARPDLAAEPARAVQRVLLRSDAAPRLVLRLLRGLEDAALVAQVADAAYRCLVVEPRPSSDGRAALGILIAAGCPPERYGHAGWPRGDAAVDEVLKALPSAASSAMPRLAETLDGMDDPTSEQLDEVVAALLVRDPRDAERVLALARAAVRERLLFCVRALWTAPPPPSPSAPATRAVAALFLLAIIRRPDSTVEKAERRALTGTLEGVVRTMDESARGAVWRLLEGSNEADRWLKWRDGQPFEPVRREPTPAAFPAPKKASAARTRGGRRLWSRKER